MNLCNNSYSRTNAVRYAKTYALTPNPNFRYFPIIKNESGDCANFVSQCLLAGGACMQLTTNNAWWYKKSHISSNNDTWSISWTVAHSLYWHLKVNQEVNNFGIKCLEVFNITNLDIGDLIFYRNNEGLVFHSAIITAFSNSKPLICEHSFEALDLLYTKSWPAKRIHFLKISI